jgi:hypothetical protein
MIWVDLFYELGFYVANELDSIQTTPNMTNYRNLLANPMHPNAFNWLGEYVIDWRNHEIAPNTIWIAQKAQEIDRDAYVLIGNAHVEGLTEEVSSIISSQNLPFSVIPYSGNPIPIEFEQYIKINNNLKF